MSLFGGLRSIATNWGADLIKEGGGLLAFIRDFEESFKDEQCVWLNKCKNRPKHEGKIIYVYVIVCNQVRYRLQYAGYDTGITNVRNGTVVKSVTWPRILMVGPMVKAPHKIYFRGFQGFRYTTKLF
jgi:hypothetical protein